MTPATTILDTRATTSSADEDKVQVDPRATGASHPGSGWRVPLVMPSSQEYYWRYEWQQGERESSAERAAGATVRFDSDDPEDILLWLHEPEDEAE